VDWLNSNVEGFIDRRHSRKYAALMLKHNFIRHTVNKITFSEQCYYIFGDLKAAANSLPAGTWGEIFTSFSQCDVVKFKLIDSFYGRALD